MAATIMVIDDHPLVRKGISSVLADEPCFTVVGEAGTVEQALEVLQRHRPHFAILDLRLGGRNGLEVIEAAQKLNIDCKFIILTSFSNKRDFLRAEQLGVCGYLLKEALPDEMIYALKIISQGRKYYDPGVIEIKIKNQFQQTEDLTPRECEVLQALGKGLSNSDIAAQIFVSENTVKKHVSQILSKLDLPDRTQAALFAYSRGLVHENF